MNVAIVKSLVRAAQLCVEQAQTEPTSEEFKDLAIDQIKDLLNELSEELEKGEDHVTSN